ncbi:MAG: alginate O-acetyltransferase complex protein AlgI [Candidatus Latescibacterota bacterium]|jgi:alginate O-acetyltransferase complex protein AlgI
MLFNSYTFMIFFAIVLILSRIIANWTYRKFMLLCLSYLFYAAWNPPFVALLWISTIVDWHAARKLYESQNIRSRKFYLFVSLFVNMGMLSYFKYSGFVVENINTVFASFDSSLHYNFASVILPVGISFYTFQTMSYTIDIYRGKLKPGRSFLDYALYVTFFPQLVAGPIVRATDFLPQCEIPRVGTQNQMGWGLCLFVIGLFSKVVIADSLMSPIVERVFDSDIPAGFLAAWTGTFAFSTQIFCDFFGYSTCAIGIALCLGFALPDNFRFPYAAIGFSDFWQRWHISLSTWLKDYLYIPMGGNRKGTMRTYVNLSVTMLLGGLWHGASWMFVIWGGLHGLYLIAERILVKTPLATLSVWTTTFGRTLLTVFTFLLVCLTWVFFRAPEIERAFSLCNDMLDIKQAAACITTMLHPTHSIDFAQSILLGRFDYLIAIACTLLLLGIHAHLKESSLEAFFDKLPRPVSTVALATMVYIVVISMTGEDRAFIYFQF